MVSSALLVPVRVFVCINEADMQLVVQCRLGMRQRESLSYLFRIWISSLHRACSSDFSNDCYSLHVSGTQIPACPTTYMAIE